MVWWLCVGRGCNPEVGGQVGHGPLPQPCSWDELRCGPLKHNLTDHGIYYMRTLVLWCKRVQPAQKLNKHLSTGPIWTGTRPFKMQISLFVGATNWIWPLPSHIRGECEDCDCRGSGFASAISSMSLLRAASFQVGKRNTQISSFNTGKIGSHRGDS